MRQILIFICIILVSLSLSVGIQGVYWLRNLVIYLSYPSLFLAFVVWLAALYRIRRRPFSLRKLLPRKREAWIAILGVTGLLLLYEPFEFKIVYDEVILSATAEFMHYTRIAGLPQAGNDYGGSYHLQQAMVDKRPLFFQFLLSLVHDLTGYRYTNAFLLNGLLTFCLVTLVYSVARRLSNHRAGILAVLLAGTIPIFSIMATSGHFEVLNLVMLCAVMLLSLQYLRNPSENQLVPLVYALILLSQVRYENALYLLTFGILILLGWHKAGRVILPWQVLISPMFFIIPTLHYRIILNQDIGLFQAGPNGRLDTFSTSYAVENLQSAVRFLFSLGSEESNSILVSIIGIVAVAVFCWYGLKRSRKMEGADPRATVLFIFFMSIALLGVVITFFNYGLLDVYITSRLSMPFYLLFILLVSYFAARMGKQFLTLCLIGGLVMAALIFGSLPPAEIRDTGFQFAPAILIIVGACLWILRRSTAPVRDMSILVIAYILTIGMPISHAHRYSKRYISNDLVMAEIDFMKEVASKERILWVSAAPYAAFLFKINTALPRKVKEHPNLAKYHLENGSFDAIYFSRKLERKGIGPYGYMEDRDRFDPDVFEMSLEKRYQLGHQFRMEILRLEDVNLPGENPDD